MAGNTIGREGALLSADNDNGSLELKPTNSSPLDSLYNLLLETTQRTAAANFTENATLDDLNSTQAANDTTLSPHPMFVETWLMPAVFTLIFLVGVTGNFLVIFVILKHKRMRTTTNFYILSLAISDFSFLLFCVPFTATVNTTQWYYGSFMCKFSFYLINVSVQATCITLTAMMVDRYYAISHPLKSLQNRTPTVALMVSLGIWIASLLLCIPVAQYRKVEYMDWFGTRPFCIEVWPSPTWEIMWFFYMFVVAYLVPLLIISVCIGMILRLVWKSSTMFQTTQSKAQRARQRKKIRKTRMVCVVILIFSMCWLPVHIVNIKVRFDKSDDVDMVTYGFQLFSNCLSYANSCVNPIIYAFMSENFRRRFREIFSCGPRKKARSRERGTIIIAMADGKPVYTRRSRSSHVRRLHGNHHCEMTVCDSPSSNPFMSDSDDSVDSPVMRRNGRHNFVERAVRL